MSQSVSEWVSQSVSLFVCQSVSQSVQPFSQSSQSVCLSVFLSVCESVSQSVCLSPCLSVSQSIYQSVFLSVCHLSVSQFKYLICHSVSPLDQSVVLYVLFHSTFVPSHSSLLVHLLIQWTINYAVKSFLGTCMCTLYLTTSVNLVSNKFVNFTVTLKRFEVRKWPYVILWVVFSRFSNFFIQLNM